MQQYIIRRLLLMIPVLIGVSIATFVLIRIVPGDIAVLKCGRGCTPEQVDLIRKQLGTDKPIVTQYFEWIGGIFRGDMGKSLYTRQPVVDELKRRIPITMELAILALAVASAIAIPIGIVSAIRQDTPLDYAGRLFSIAGLAIPSFWIATLVFTLPAIWWKWVPPTRYKDLWDDPIHNLTQMIIPAAILGLGFSAIQMRLTRSAMLEVLRQDYIRTAWAKGLRERVVLVRHALKNALIPVITVMGIQLAALLGGTVIMEQIFVIPGLGRSTFLSVFNRDYPQLQANVMFLAVVYVTMNLLVDLAYGFLDPRIRYR